MPPTNFTGNPAGVEPPDAGPVANGAPVGALPADGDPPNGATFAQAYKALLDWSAFNSQRIASSPWGTGADGDVTIGSTIQLTSDPMYNNLTIGPSGVLVAGNWVIRVKKTLTVLSGGKIIDALSTFKNGGNATLTGAGPAGTGTNDLSDGSVLGGANGGIGGLGTGAPGGVVGVAGNGVTQSFGGVGGVGGAGDAGAAGGAAGSRALIGVSLSSMVSALAMPGWVAIRSGTSSARSGGIFGIQGGSGGGGGGSGGGGGAQPGGGGGAGGGVIIIIAQKVILATTTDVMAVGGTGGIGLTGAFSGGGGGAGGGGGTILLYYGTKSGPTLSTSLSVAGGPGGSGNTNAGAAGTAGQVREFNLGY